MNKPPLRQCISCRSQLTRDQFIRLTRIRNVGTNGELVVVNPDHYHFGRSAYLCKLPACVNAAIKQKKIAKILRVSSKAIEGLMPDLKGGLQNND